MVFELGFCDVVVVLVLVMMSVIHLLCFGGERLLVVSRRGWIPWIDEGRRGE